MKKFASAMIVLAAAATLVGCNNTVKTGIGYGKVHNHYVGEAKVELKGGKLTSVKFEEYYLPYNAGALVKQAAWDTTVPENVIERSVTNATSGAVTKSYYAKYFRVDTKVYVGSLDASNVIQYLDGSVNIEKWVETEANAKSYVEATAAGKVFVIDSATAEAKSTSLVVSGNAATGWKKSETGYWSDDKYPLGWKGNMEAIERAFVEIGLDVEYTLNADKKWESGTVVTGATLTDFKDYQAVAKRAVANAK